MFKKASILFLILSIAPLNLYAGSFNILPLKVFLDSKNKADNLVIKNQGDKAVTLRVKVSEWSQNDEGKDVLQPAADLSFVPRIFSVDPGKEGKIKVGYSMRPEKAERTFRVFIEEVPQADPGAEEGMALRMALTVSIPIFIAPQKKEGPKGEISGIKLSNGVLSFNVANKGNGHFFIKEIKAVGVDSSGKETEPISGKGWYVLSGKTRPYSMTVPPDRCGTLREMNIEMEAEGLALKEKIDVDKKMCAN